MKKHTMMWRVLSLVVALFAALSLTFAPVLAPDFNLAPVFAEDDADDADDADAIAPVPQTGQTTCWDPGTNAPLASCSGTGQDGDFQAGTALPSPRFTDNGDGTVTDNLTRLIWLQEANCVGTKSWADALSFANNLDDPQCGLMDGSVSGDWRLPNVRELQSLFHYGFFGPALSDAAGTARWTTNADAFTNFPPNNIYWSSTTGENSPVHAWAVGSFGGNVFQGLKTDVVIVLPVRGP